VLLNIDYTGIFIRGVLVCLLILLLYKNFVSQQNYYHVNIDYMVSGRLLSLAGTIDNNSSQPADVFYRFSVNKASNSGKASTNQSGQMHLKANSTTILTESSLDLSDDAVYRINLIVEKGNTTVADKVIELKGSEIQKH
jgi:hypothetical protein